MSHCKSDYVPASTHSPIGGANTMLRRLALSMLYGYRRWLSPRKRWRCASGVRHGVGQSCSDVALRIIAEQSAWQWWAELRRQFQRCREAKLYLDDDDADDDDEHHKRKRRCDRCTNSCEGVDVCDCLPNELPDFDCNCDGCSMPDLSCDCGGLHWRAWRQPRTRK